jgi:hypothetical protein
MLFNLSSGLHFPNTRKTKNAIWCSKYNGPYFTGGDSEELSAYEPFNGEGKCRSCPNESGYSIPVDEWGVNMLTNT